MTTELVDYEEEPEVILFSKAEIIEAIDIVLKKVKEKQGYKGLAHSNALQSVTDSFKFQMHKQLKLKE